MTKNAFDRDTFTASVDAAPEAINAFARLGLEQGDRASDVAGDTGTDRARATDPVDAEFAATERRLRGVERRSVLTAPVLALVERLRGWRHHRPHRTRSSRAPARPGRYPLGPPGGGGRHGAAHPAERRGARHRDAARRGRRRRR
ncbi:hypothetical protein Q9Q99_05405 [Curtobacterium flaccumfaciens]|nr:hypothetical protein Q9Q99_05405 [Curtobacterium flaccumfaciens]